MGGDDMQTIIILLDPAKLENPDLDLRYYIPECIEELSEGRIISDGYDFINTEIERNDILAIWLKTEDASKNWHMISELLKNEPMKGNDLSKSAQIYISQQPEDDLRNCSLVYSE